MRIGLIAMSGIRVCDEELLRLGLTLPGFVERSKIIASLPSLALLTLAGMTPAGHEVTYSEISDLAKAKESLRLLDSLDLVALSSYSAQIGEAYKLADECRRRGIPVILGGLHVSSRPTEAKAHCDAVVIGEGEVSWPQVVQDADNGALQPFYGSVGEEFSLADAPMPSFELLDTAKYNRLTVQTSRGCPHRCEFCAGSVLITQRYKQKPIEKVLAEIDKICEIWERPFIEFADDNTFIDFAYWKELLARLTSRKLRWFTETDISVARDPELLGLMRDSGCAQVLIGFESPTRAALDGLETRSNWKLEQWSLYEDAIRAIQSHGISVDGCFVLGLDGHGPEIFDQVFEFVMKTELHEVQITLQTAFPGTPLYERLSAEGRILEDEAWDKCTLFDVNFQPKHMTADELKTRFRDLGIRLYSEEFTRLRRERFRKYLRACKPGAAEKKRAARS
ncbi:MAG: B12-binding domain-containing radical SAM protein [bacterium]|nr:B12-binding domain-containing radical SAM protein [bacterium]